MTVALWLVSVVCLVGWVLVAVSQIDLRIARLGRAQAQYDLARERIKMTRFLEFLQEHPQLLPRAVVRKPQRWYPRSHSINYKLQEELIAAGKRVAQHSDDLDLLDEAEIDY